MTKSPSEARLGCLICNDPRKDEWFAQIVECTAHGVLGYSVVASYLGVGREETLKRVCDFAGLKAVPGRATYDHVKHAPPVGVVHSGLRSSMIRCESAVRDLAGLLGSFRRLHDALSDTIETLEEIDYEETSKRGFRIARDGRGHDEPDSAAIRDGREDAASENEGLGPYREEEWI